jgi:hypothetical protein
VQHAGETVVGKARFCKSAEIAAKINRKMQISDADYSAQLPIQV